MGNRFIQPVFFIMCLLSFNLSIPNMSQVQWSQNKLYKHYYGIKTTSSWVQALHVFHFLKSMSKIAWSFFQHQNLNALQILNAQTILHALGKNARIPASPQLVESMLNAGFKGTELSASVGQGMREIPTASVKNVRSFYFAPKSQSFTDFFLFYNN